MDIWELATKIRKEADRFEETMSETNGEVAGIKADIKFHLEELESLIEEVKEKLE